MRNALVMLFAAVLNSAIGATVVDFYLDMEVGTNGQVLTTNLLNACTHVAPGAGYWTFSRGHPQYCTDCFDPLAAVTDFVVLPTAGTNGVWPLRSAVRVNGVTYDGALHSRVFGKGLTSRNQTAQFNFSTPHLRLSLGYYYTMAVGYKGQNLGDYPLPTGLYYYANERDWEFDILAGWANNYNALVFVHSSAGGPQHTSTIGIAVTKTYWVTQLWDGSNGVCKVEVYDPLTWAKVGNTSQLVLSNLPCQFFQFGDMQNTNSSFAVTNCFGNLIMDWTTARFPLLLPAAPPPPPTNIVISWTPSNSATLLYSTNENGFAWQTYSNNATPPVTILKTQLLPQELFRVRSSNSTRLFIKRQ
jgi:hypothetical protein